MVIETFGLTKQYNGKGGCRDISITVAPGIVYGLLGPNGAGKSTLVKTLVGLLQPTSGKALVMGELLGTKKSREKIGFLPELFRYQDWLKGEELLTIHGELYGMKGEEIKKRIPEVLELVGLKGSEKKKVGSYSKGMQQRIGIGCALMNRPNLLFLDEPSSALDPIGRKEVRNVISNLKQNGATVFLNSHLLGELEMVCDQIAVINKGELIESGNLHSLLEKRLEVQLELGEICEALINEIRKIGSIVNIEGSKINLKIDNREKIPLLVRRIVEKGGLLYNIQYKHHSLEDLFFDLLNKEGGLC